MNDPYEVVCFGELLWDVLPDRELPGGAPMNVTYHLSKLGKTAALISRTGDDERGRVLKSIFESKHINTQYVQTDAEHKTSTVKATPNEAGDMQYEIVENVAWDFIRLQPEQEALIANARYFVFGSLATRSKTSRNTLFQLMDIPCRKVLDINLRAPFINKALLEYQLSRTQVLKMNEEELLVVAGWYVRFNTVEDNIKWLQDRFHIETLIVTCGAKGAVVSEGGRLYRHQGVPVRVADTIGSGDSFLAAFLSKSIGTETTASALAFACSVGAFVATRQGGCPDYSPADIDRFYNGVAR